MYKEYGDGIGKQHKFGCFKDIMLLMYDYYSLVIIFGVKYDLGLSDFVLDEKYLWVF